MAFVIVQHLDPTRESLTAEILARYSKMRVVQIHDEPTIKCNRIYVIPPGKYLSIVDGELHLSEPAQPRGSRMAVDFFLRSLAEARGELAAAVILSGSGTDGALGAQAVKEAGGLVIAQDPRSAEHDGMPRATIDIGVVDIIAPPERIGEELSAYARFALAIPPEDANDREEAEHSEHLRRLVHLLRTRGQRDFRAYKEATLLRRARRRAALRRFANLDEYVDYLAKDGEEVGLLARDLLINVTRFFRDGDAWADLERLVLEPLVARKGDDEPIRVWVPGCATGEEAYSIALLLMEHLRRAGKLCPLQIFATDVASHALDLARSGRYPQSIEADVPPHLLSRYFVQRNDGHYYHVGKGLREAIVFSSQDVLADPPFSRLDLVCCRNLLIYLKPDVQQNIIALFHFALAHDGALFLGSAETVGSYDDSFATLSKRWRIYRRIGPTQHGRVDFPVATAAGYSQRNSPSVSLGGAQQAVRLAERWLLDWLAPSAVLINSKWRILHISGDLDGYLARGSGAPSDDLLANLRKGISAKLRGAVRRATEERRTITVSARIRRHGASVPVSVAVRPVPSGSEEVDHLLVVFRDGAAQPARDSTVGATAADDKEGATDGDAHALDVVQQLEDELAATRGELRSTIAQLESSSEEFRASTEEVMSINEELRSTNEELETSKEELQSLNEELHTVNDQLATKLGELESKNSDLENLQAATDIATICLDTELRLRWLTPSAASVIRLKRADVGRPISDFAHDFARDDLVAAAETVLRKLTLTEDEVACNDGRVFLRRVTPYRTDNRIGGVVITFIDVSQRKRDQQAVYDAKELAEKIIDTVGHPMLVLDSSYKVQRVNAAYLDIFGMEHIEVLHRGLIELNAGVFNIPELLAALARVLRDRRAFDGVEITATFERLGQRTMLLSAQPINDLQLILLVIEDITERKGHDDALRAGERRLRRVIENDAVGVLFFDNEGTILDANEKFLQMTGFGRAEVESRSLSLQRLTPAEHIVATSNQLKRLATTGRVGPYEKEYFRKDGSRMWLMVAGAGLDDGTAVEFCIDVTSHKRAEETIAEGDRRKDEFLATLAHELRNPLAPITTAIQFLRRSPDDPATRERMYAMMERQLAHLVRLVDDLLDLARISRGFIELRMEVLDVTNVVRTALETTLPRIEAGGRRLSAELPDKPVFVRADAVRLAQVVINLLNNAASYTEKNGTIWLKLGRDDEHAVICVRDDGVGIAPDMLTKVFEMFMQVDRAKAGGLGIGLTLAKNFVDLHGGTLEATSDGLGHGSEFIVRLPLSEDSAQRAPDHGATDTGVAAQRVLVVDDNRDAADSLAMILGALGAEVQIAYDGPGALRVCETFAPDVVFLDIGMPGMDGYEVARRFHGAAANGTLDCTLVALTGWAQESDRMRTARAGFNHHLTKPVAVDALLEVMGRRKAPLAIQSARVAPAKNKERG